MPSYKLVYFLCKGRAETARMLFALAGQSYEDVRLDMEGNAWKEYKPNTPFGDLPLREVDSVVIAGSYAVSRYLAKTFGFAGKTPLDAARVDMIADAMKDFMKQLEDLYWCRDETKKLTWADLCFNNQITWPGMMEIEVPWDKAPKLKALKERVEAVPEIAEWIKKRPQTKY